MESYFSSMASKKTPMKTTYYMKQRGRGIGKSGKRSGLCSISQTGGGREAIVSPAQHLINQAKSEVSHKKRGTKRKRSVSSSQPRKKHRKSSKSTGRKKKKRTKKKSQKKKRKGKKNKKKRKKGKKKTKGKHRRKDIFS